MHHSKFFFIDESGDPNFYGRRKRPLWLEPTFEPVLILGMVVVRDRHSLQKTVRDFQQKILADPLYNSIPSISQPGWYIHASKDHVEVRSKFIELLREMKDLEVYFAIGRKVPEIFHEKHNGKTAEFYFDMLNKLLGLFEFEDEMPYHLYLSERQSNTTERFEEALQKTFHIKSRRYDSDLFKCRITPAKDYPELSVVDYFLWALKRYITTGERRFFTALERHVKEIYDVYEDEGTGRMYNRANPFELSKASPFNKK